MQTRTKHPLESRLYNFRFDEMPEMRDGEVIASVTAFGVVSKKPASAVDPSFITFSFSDKAAQARIEDGDDRATYILECVVTTDGANTLVGRGELEVRSDI